MSLSAPRPSRVALAARASLLLLAVLWGEELVDRLVFGGQLDALGIRPRSLEGLRGLLFAPFLHASFAHLLANSLPCALLSFLIALRSVGRLLGVTAAVALGGGFGVWLTAPPGTLHLGASLLVFGYLGYLLGQGYYERRPSSVLLAALALLLYGGALWGVLPLVPGVSWQSHLFGLLSGVLAARLWARR